MENSSKRIDAIRENERVALVKTTITPHTPNLT